MSGCQLQYWIENSIDLLVVCVHLFTFLCIHFRVLRLAVTFTKMVSMVIFHFVRLFCRLFAFVGAVSLFCPKKKTRHNSVVNTGRQVVLYVVTRLIGK
jgi:hypothetical protein